MFYDVQQAALHKLKVIDKNEGYITKHDSGTTGLKGISIQQPLKYQLNKSSICDDHLLPPNVLKHNRNENVPHKH